MELRVFRIILLFTIAGSLSGCSAGLNRPNQTDYQPDLSGFWETVWVSPEDPSWPIIDVLCQGLCTDIQHNYLQSLIEDPANDDRELRDLFEQSEIYYAEQLADQLTVAGRHQQDIYDPSQDAALDCNPDGDGLHHQVLAPPPILIEHSDNYVTFRYEYWNAVRTIYLDGRNHPGDGDHSRLGHSTGRYEGSDLIVETTNLLPMDVWLLGGTGNIMVSADTIFTERYSRSDDGNRLELEWSIIDATNLREPLVGLTSYRLVVDGELDEWDCEAITGEY